MADTQAVQFVQSIYRRTDQQIRDILATVEGGVEVDTINVIVGDGLAVMVPGVGAVLRVDFRARITGAFLQEFDGVTGSVGIIVYKAQGGAAPSWVQISGASCGISSGRYFADNSLSDWSDDALERGDYLRFNVDSATTMTRVHIGLRIRRLEP